MSPPQYKAVRTRLGRCVHSTLDSDYQKTTCGLTSNGLRLAHEAPNCKRCLSIMLEALQ